MKKNAYCAFCPQSSGIAKQQTRKAAAGGDTDLNQGDRVKHGKFGEGLVISVTDSIVTVAFDTAGIKKLAKGIAPLKKL